jgi:uncharacterized membrane protein YgcG
MLRILRVLAVLLVCITALFGHVAPCEAREEILSYDVDATLRTDGVMVVRETIKVNVENRKIRHGITRSYPVRQRVGEKGLRHYTFKMLSTQLDGEPVPHAVSTGGGYMAAVAIGSAKTTVSKGIHTYELVYESDGHVRFLDEHDEIFLNAIGTDNAFRVNTAFFQLHLPAGALVQKTDGFTGRRGSQEKAFEQVGQTSFRTTRVLRPGEAFTVAVAWNKGVINQKRSIPNLVAEYRDPISIALGLLFAAVSFLFWWRKRRNPITVYPRFSPPEGYSPGALATFRSQGKTAVVISDMVWTSVWGWSTLESAKEKTKPCYCRADPRKESRSWHYAASGKIRNLILGDNERISIGATPQFRKILKSLEKEHEAEVADLQRLGSLLPLALPLLAFALFWLLMNFCYHEGYASRDGALLTLFMWSVITLIGTAFLGFWLKHKASSALGAIGAVLVQLVPACLFYALTLIVSDCDWALVIPVMVSLAAPLGAFFFPVCIMTDKGRQIDAHLSGLQMYIETAEKNRLAAINAPDDTLEKYEEILPYAIALGCAEAWQKRFEALLSESDYKPAWADRDFARGSAMPVQLAAFEKSIGKAVTALAAADAARRAASASTRTSSGGGFSRSSSSGRGSGGGGVGGW